MVPYFSLLLVLVSVATAQFFPPRPPPGSGPGNSGNPGSGQNSIACGFSCTRQASFSVLIDGQFTTARCTDSNASPTTRCGGCCAAKALAGGLQTTNAAGFPSTNGVDCVCCIFNPCSGF